MLVKWVGVEGMDKEALVQKLYLHGERELFYGIEEERWYYEMSIACLSEVEPPTTEEMIKLGMNWTILTWMTDDSLFRELLEQTASMRLAASQIEQMMVMAIEEWGKYLENSLFQFDDAKRPQTWQGWVLWLKQVCQRVQAYTSEQPYSLAVTASIMKAVQMIQHELKTDIQLPDIARKVHMSRSYFSRCFRDIVGTTFQDYIRELRVQHAKLLLRETNKSIGWIASESGYPNERYFSRLFRETTGLVPRDYRKQYRKRND